MKTSIDIHGESGLVIGRVYEIRPGNFGFATPDGSQGDGYKTFDEAEAELRSCLTQTEE